MNTSDLIINSEMTNTGCNDIISQESWSQFYEVIEESLPTNMPTPRGQVVKINMFCDAEHATDLVTRRSNTGIICFLTPIMWHAE